MMHKREQSEAGDKNKHALQSFDESNSTEPAREMRIEGCLIH